MTACCLICSRVAILFTGGHSTEIFTNTRGLPHYLLSLSLTQAKRYHKYSLASLPLCLSIERSILRAHLARALSLSYAFALTLHLHFLPVRCFSRPWRFLSLFVSCVCSLCVLLHASCLPRELRVERERERESHILRSECTSTLRCESK